MKDGSLILALQEARKESPCVGDVYRHYKGGIYQVVCKSVDEETLKILVTYMSDISGHVWTRTLDNWNSLVDGKPRFEKVQGRHGQTVA